MAEIILPMEKRPPVAIDPGSLFIYAAPKVGKTTIVAQLPNSLLIELEPEGADYVEANVISAKSPKEFEDILAAILAAGCPYTYLVIDTATKLDEWSELVGTMNYMEKGQGQKFNRDRAGNKMTPADQRFETVHSLGNGYGYAHSRDVMDKWYKMVSKCAKHVIWLAHIKDKFIEAKKSGDTVETTDINLTGKVKGMYCSRVSGVAYMYRRDNKAYLNFDNENSIACGNRVAHLNGQIEISERNEDLSVTTHWDRIFTQEKF